MVLRAKTVDLFLDDNLTDKQMTNSKLNLQELLEGKTVLKSYPRRIVLELTNACNLNCIMCGRNSAEFKKTFFNMDWLDRLKEVLEYTEEVTLMGWGEPTLHPQFQYIFEYLNKYNVRKYFCTNGTKLGILKETIFKDHVDIIAVSLDGANSETNNKIRCGSNFNKIVKNLEDIVEEKAKNELKYPYINFVFTAMQSNYKQIPDMVRLAHNIGIDEVKVVYLTAFSQILLDQSLYNHSNEVKEVFDEATKLSEELKVNLKLPYIQGEDPAGNKRHGDCFVAWRDFFIGSDGYVRPCMSTPIKLFEFNRYKDFGEMWNSTEFQSFRKGINVSGLMPKSCENCYQSSCANWNKRGSFIQIEKTFAPKWDI